MYQSNKQACMPNPETQKLVGKAHLPVSNFVLYALLRILKVPWQYKWKTVTGCKVQHIGDPPPPANKIYADLYVFCSIDKEFCYRGCF